MIKITNVEIASLKPVIRGMRNPMNSWDRSDSIFTTEKEMIGEEDYKLMKRLVNAGTDHSKFMRMITITMDITAPLYWWKEFDTYKVGTVRNSCSTMHKIHSKRLSTTDFSVDQLNEDSLEVLESLIRFLNTYRADFVKRGDKNSWWQLIQLLPSSYNQTATVQLNYATLRNIYHSRKKHKLDEWLDFCKWIHRLPLSELITCN